MDWLYFLTQFLSNGRIWYWIVRFLNNSTNLWLNLKHPYKTLPNYCEIIRSAMKKARESFLALHIFGTPKFSKCSSFEFWGCHNVLGVIGSRFAPIENKKIRKVLCISIAQFLIPVTGILLYLVGQSYLGRLKQVPDFRWRQGKVYPPWSLLGMPILAVLNRKSSLWGMWLWGWGHWTIISDRPLGFMG